MNNFAKLIYELRKEKGFTQAELAEKINITDKAISKWENGECFPETAQLIALSKLFDISIDSLLKGVKEEKKESEVQRFLEEMKKREKPLTRKESVTVAIAVGIILFGLLLGASLFFAEAGLFASLCAAIICIAPAVFLLIKMGTEKFMNDAGLDEKYKPAGKRSATTIAVAVGLLVLILIPASYMIINSTFNIVALLIGGTLLIAGILTVIIGGTDWWREVLANINAQQQVKMPLKFKLIGIICSASVLVALAVFLLLGLIGGLWHPAWVAFPISFLVCGIAAVALGS